MTTEKEMLYFNEFKIISCDKENIDYKFNVRPRYPTIICPLCGKDDYVSNVIYNRFVRNLNYFDYKVGVEIYGNRHKCKTMAHHLLTCLIVLKRGIRLCLLRLR